MDDRLPPGQPVDDDIEKAAEIPPEHQEQSEHHHIRQRDDPIVHGNRILLTSSRSTNVPGSRAATAEASWKKFSVDHQRTLAKLFFLQMRWPKLPEKLFFRRCSNWKMVSTGFFHHDLD